MTILAYRDAVRRALDEEMARDENVIFFGEDVARAGGVFKVTPGLFEKYGEDRVRDTPISETAIIGAAIGAAITGLRPVVEIMFADFAAVAYDQIINQAAKMRYMSGGQISVPITIRMANGAGMSFGAQHSQSCEGWFMSVPGLKVAAPGTPADALGLLKTAVRDPNPVIFLEHKALYSDRAEIPDGEYLVPFGKAAICREGRHVTLVAIQRMVQMALKAADLLAQEGIECEVIDLRTLAPLDVAAVQQSVCKTTRLITVEEAPAAGGWGGVVISQIMDEAIWCLDAPVLRVTMGEGIVPFSPPLERALIPDEQQIIAAVRQLGIKR